MLNDKNQLRKIIMTVADLFIAEKDILLADIVRTSEYTSEMTHFDNWNGGTEYYSIFISVPVDLFVKIKEKQSDVESDIQKKIELQLRAYENTLVREVCIIPKSDPKVEWDKIADLFNKEQLILEVNYLKATMISVATGGQTIQDINEEYNKRYLKVDKALKQLSIDNPNPFKDLWQWHGRWSSGEMKQYKDRRIFISKMYDGLLELLEETEQSDLLVVSVSMSGWERIDRNVKEIKVRLSQASNEEQFQSVGHLCREAIISLAQAVYDEKKYPILDGVQVSKTDAKRMLDAYIKVELAGGANENLRKYARASLDLANELTHKRTADAKDASICAAATIGLINLVVILENRH